MKHFRKRGIGCFSYKSHENHCEKRLKDGRDCKRQVGPQSRTTRRDSLKI